MLPAILQLVLETGNFLNEGASYGNASGFSISSLKTLVETKANQPGITLMHYVAMELEKQDDRMLFWSDQIPSLSSAKIISVEELLRKLSECKTELKRLKEHLKEDNSEDLKEKMENFFEVTNIKLLWFGFLNIKQS